VVENVGRFEPQFAGLNGAEWRRIPLEPAESRGAYFPPVISLYLPVKRELSPCYAPVLRPMAVFDQTSENKRVLRIPEAGIAPEQGEKGG
jgi:hypothetical protein